MASTPASIERPSMEYLTHLGPYRVAAGELGTAGLRGLVFAPVSGQQLPLVAFAHHWLQPVRRYADTLRYLASWGIVAVAPATERGPLPSYSGLAHDLTTAVQLVSTSRLGDAAVTIDQSKIAVAGHGTGGGAAVLAAAANPQFSAVVAINPANVVPSAITAAGTVVAPGLLLAAGSDTYTPAKDNAELIARAWAGPVHLRIIRKGAHLGLVEGSHWTSMLLGEKRQKQTQHIARSLMTAFLLRHLNGQEQLADELTDPVAGTVLVDLGAS